MGFMGFLCIISLQRLRWVFKILGSAILVTIKDSVVYITYDYAVTSNMVLFCKGLVNPCFSIGVFGLFLIDKSTFHNK